MHEHVRDLSLTALQRQRLQSNMACTSSAAHMDRCYIRTHNTPKLLGAALSHLSPKTAQTTLAHHPLLSSKTRLTVVPMHAASLARPQIQSSAKFPQCGIALAAQQPSS